MFALRRLALRRLALRCGESWGGRSVPGFWIAVVSFALLSGCIVEERRFDADEAARHRASLDDDAPQDSEPEVDSGSERQASCGEYCDRAMQNCTDEFAIYASVDACLSICAQLPLEDAANDNTVSCRSEQARLAGSTGEPDVHCPAAGPGGAASSGQAICGSNCESYCRLHPLICGETDQLVLEEEECLRRCAVLPDRGTFDVVADHDRDVVQCRLVHLSSAALGAAATESHCWHAAIAPRPDSPCRTPDGVEPDCPQYCDIVSAACTDDNAVYANRADCLAACGALQSGTGADTVEDTVGCRLYHAYSSLEAPSTHCAHAGPSGDGHCGDDVCGSYCRLAAGLCTEAYQAEYDSEEACLAACAALEGSGRDQGYTLAASDSGDTVACRIHHAVGSATDPSACAAALGGVPCR